MILPVGSTRSLAASQGLVAQSMVLAAPLLAGLDCTDYGLHPASPPDPPPLLANVMGTLESPALPSPWEMKEGSQKCGWRSCCPPPAALPATGTAARAPKTAVTPCTQLTALSSKGMLCHPHSKRREQPLPAYCEQGVLPGSAGLFPSTDGGRHCQHPQGSQLLSTGLLFQGLI